MIASAASTLLLSHGWQFFFKKVGVRKETRSNPHHPHNLMYLPPRFLSHTHPLYASSSFLSIHFFFSSSPIHFSPLHPSSFHRLSFLPVFSTFHHPLQHTHTPPLSNPLFHPSRSHTNLTQAMSTTLLRSPRLASSLSSLSSLSRTFLHQGAPVKVQPSHLSPSCTNHIVDSNVFTR